jgi:hypothetical protein
MSNPSFSRRDTLKWLTGTVAAGTAGGAALGAPQAETEVAPASWPLRNPIHDPNFMAKTVFPWQKLMTEAELATTKSLVDLILPKDDQGPAASEVGAHDFINEWISAPYDKNVADSEAIRGGLGWLNTESFKRFGSRFEELSVAQQGQIIDDICHPDKSKPELQTGVVFFKEFRQLALSGYYTHSSTWKHLGYVGNISIGGPYPGVPVEIIKQLGLEDVA